MNGECKVIYHTTLTPPMGSDPRILQPLLNHNSTTTTGVQIHRVLFWLGAAEGAGEVGGAAEARLCRDFFKCAALATKKSLCLGDAHVDDVVSGALAYGFSELAV